MVIKKIDLNNNKFIIKTFLNLDDCQIGSSICCDGVCLTATKIIRIDNEYNFYVNIGEETIQRSNLSSWYVYKKINFNLIFF